MNLGDDLSCFSAQDLRDEVCIPGLSLRNPKINNCLREARLSDWQIKMIMDKVPDTTPAWVRTLIEMVFL